MKKIKSFIIIFTIFLLFSCEKTTYIENNTQNNSGIQVKETQTNSGTEIQTKANSGAITSSGNQITDTKKYFDIKNLEVKPWIEGLDTPWELVFLDNDTALVTQRNGIISKIYKGILQKENYYKADSTEISEGGLMGIAKDPDFKNNNYLYIMYTYKNNLGVKNKVVRLVNEGNTAKLDKTIIENIPGDRYHNGGRIKFGPDGKLYIATGDASDHPSAQDLKSLAGKILRLNADGSIPSDNPFENSPVYSYGHRNPQGIAFDSKTGDLFISVHGPTGEYGWSKKDRIDYIVPGGNYGRPNEPGYSEKYKNPIIFWDKEGNPPGGITFWNDKLVIPTLKSQNLFFATLEKENNEWKQTKLESIFKEEYGRLRDVVVGPDNNLYLLTSNKDGRGTPKKGDDKILIIKTKE